MAQVFRPPVYVPRPPDIPVWQGKPVASNIEFLKPFPPFHKMWRDDYVPDPPWQTPNEFMNSPAQFMLQRRPFAKDLWQWNYDPPPPWSMTPDNMTANTLLLFVVGGQPFSKLWQWNYDPPPPWQMPSAYMAASTNNILVKAGEPFFRLWQWNYDSDTRIWLSGPIPIPGPIFNSVVNPPLSPKPIFNQWRDDVNTDTALWLGTPVSSAVLKFVTAGGMPFSKLWREDILLDAPLWNWQPPGSSAIRLLTAKTPFAKDLWRWDNVPPPDWAMPPFWMGSNINRILSAKKPFNRLWQWNLEPDKFWLGHPVGVFAPRIPPPITPFFHRTQPYGVFNFEPPPPWNWLPHYPSVILPPIPPPPPPIPTPRRYSVKNLFPPNLTYTVANPNTSLPTPARTSPLVKVYLNEPATVYLGIFDIAPVEYQVTAASVSLQFIRPDGTFYYVTGSPYTYISSVNGYPYIIYTSATGEFNQIGWWTAVFSIGNAVSQQFAFYIHPPGM